MNLVIPVAIGNAASTAIVNQLSVNTTTAALDNNNDAYNVVASLIINTISDAHMSTCDLSSKILWRHGNDFKINLREKPGGQLKLGNSDSFFWTFGLICSYYKHVFCFHQTGHLMSLSQIFD